MVQLAHHLTIGHVSLGTIAFVSTPGSPISGCLDRNYWPNLVMPLGRGHRDCSIGGNWGQQWLIHVKDPVGTPESAVLQGWNTPARLQHGPVFREGMIDRRWCRHGRMHRTDARRYLGPPVRTGLRGRQQWYR